MSLELVAGSGTDQLWLAGVQVGERDVLSASPKLADRAQCVKLWEVLAEVRRKS